VAVRESGAEPVPKTRADLEKRFRETVVQLESAMRERLAWTQAGRDRRTLGNLVHEAEEKQLLGIVRLQEARLVNEVRNAQNHPTTEQISDEDLTRAIQSARAVIAAIEKP
jgi:Cu2+-containing amine oxidase